MNHNPKNPQWKNRDRFVLSGGHGSTLLYSLLHLFGYGLTKEDMMNFRQMDSLTPGHPEYGHTVGVEATTGPLGAGMGMAVGMAMAEAHLSAVFNKDGYPVVDHYTYVLGGDGCMIDVYKRQAVTSVPTTSRTAYVKDNKDVEELVWNLKPDTFYRVEKSDRKTKNDGAWMNFPSVSLFSSTANASLSDFFRLLGCESSTNAYSITGSTPLVDSLFSVLYGLYPDQQPASSPMDQEARKGGVWLYKNRYTLPVAFMLPKDVEENWIIDSGNPDVYKRQTYREMDILSSKVAAYLRDMGVETGDCVSFQVPVWSEFIVIAFGCMKAGAVMHPIAMCYEEPDLIHAMNKADTKIFFGTAWFRGKDYEARFQSVREEIRTLKHAVFLDSLGPVKGGFTTYGEILKTYPPLPPREYGRMDGLDVALILGTSGTTGNNKGVMLTHSNIIFSEEQFNRELGLDETDIMFMPAPLNHATGFHHGIIAPMLLGAKVVLPVSYTHLLM